MVVISRFRSLWGVEPGPQQSEWKKKFVEWKAHGYAGIEIDFAGMSPEELQLLRRICDEVGLETSVTLFSSWPKYIGRRPRGLAPDDHAEFFRSQLKLASILKPVRINAQSGADHFSWDESVAFYKKALQVEKEEGFDGRVCHETHRNRSLFNPYAADYILQKVPGLTITADISHWVVVSERLLDVNEEDQEILARVIPHARLTFAHPINPWQPILTLAFSLGRPHSHPHGHNASLTMSRPPRSSLRRRARILREILAGHCEAQAGDGS
ncbi:sugar phosphate isomerase/epimerase family protein [Aspergillus mulundensis]|uniref:Xylose isomerase-like TIM barrel domain-containing protein n=1 Tax=Aspergillus mulundensis TaxID=1810919 RepID=A0A3D8QHE1_9EURO|nr:hypothetical protein DSM5745_10723 [Aspergillus mulundensis]RDW61225.1 hypothetical protein DSM5745_10723 [Aspergillus mulundensis]